MRRTFTLVAALAMMLGLLALPASADQVFDWDGRQGLDSERCELDGQEGRDGNWIHWVFSTKGDSTGATLQLGGTGSGTYQPGEPLNAEVWHFYTPYFPLDGLTARMTATGGEVGSGNGLVISDYCPGRVGKIEVSKTVVTSYDRDHDWSITKTVDPDKLYLYADGSGDARVDWRVAVAYEGSTDKNHRVSGNLVIRNTGQLDATVQTVLDQLSAFPGQFVDVVCPGGLPAALPAGPTLTCTYSKDLTGPIGGFNKAGAAGTFSDGTRFNEASDRMPVAFGAPTNETNRTARVQDIGDLFGTQNLGTVTAPNGDTFTYSRSFAWADYGREDCGDHTYDNTASVIGDGDRVIDSDDASLDVHVQCEVFQGETAWAANGNVAGDLRYTPRGNWATYVAGSDTAKTTTLFAGQTIDVGRVTFTPLNGDTRIDVALSGAWEFEEVAENLKVAVYATAPSGNPEPGLFPYKKTCEVASNTCSITVPKSNFYGVHVNVGQWIPDPEFGP